MKERGIIFSGPMVPPTLDDRKTQTRRVVTWCNSDTGLPKTHRFDLARAHVDRGFPDEHGDYHDGYLHVPFWHPDDPGPDFGAVGRWLCRMQSGDRLYVKETWCDVPVGDGSRMGVIYRADGDGAEDGVAEGWEFAGKWRRSIHMHRCSSRINLDIVGVRVERVQDISEEDAKAEGVVPPGCTHPDCGPGTTCAMRRYRPEFARLWNELNAKRGFGWDANPWVWVIEFKRNEHERTRDILRWPSSPRDSLGVYGVDARGSRLPWRTRGSSLGP